MSRICLTALLAAFLLPVTTVGEPPKPGRVATATGVWKINTHLFAANKALADALDGSVTIPPFGEIPIAASARRALNAAPAAYRAGVLAPDLFPDMYVGGWFVHSDLPSERWTADDWIRHIWTKARAWPDPAERDKVLAFAYGFLTHGTGDIFAHSYVNQKADGAWITFTGPARSTAIKHIVLEGYVGANTPPTELSLDVWPRLVANVMIKDPAVRGHTVGAKHYQRWLAIYDWLGPQIERAKKTMNENVPADAPYWVKCAAHPVACAKKEQMETWRLDINRGFRALVDSSQTLGEQLMAHEVGAGVAAMTGWAKEWVPKMFGAHAIGEGAAAMQQFLQWVGDPLAPITEPVVDEVARFLKDEFPKYYQLYQAFKDPAYQMDQVGFPAGTRQLVDQEMGLKPGAAGFDWRAFAPMYNSVILAKLALLDGDGLNELARRAGVGALYPTGEDVNIMLGVFRSMTQSYQWMGGAVVSKDTGATKTTFGVCGPEGGNSLPDAAPCGAGTTRGPVGLGGGPPRGGFVLWTNPEARAKIFGVVFKGFGPGPGTSVVTDVGDVGLLAAPAVWEAGRGLRAASEVAEGMREIVANMRAKVGGVESGRAAGTGWAQRCCAKDVNELRLALASLVRESRRLQNQSVLAALSRRSAVSQLAAYAGQLNGALDAFVRAPTGVAAGAALEALARQVEGLTRLLAGTL